MVAWRVAMARSNSEDSNSESRGAYCMYWLDRQVSGSGEEVAGWTRMRCRWERQRSEPLGTSVGTEAKRVGGGGIGCVCVWNPPQSST